MVNGVFLTVNRPTDGAAGLRRDEENTIVNAHLNGSACLIIGPPRDLKNSQLITAGIELPNFIEALYPRLSAVLINYPVRTPGRQCVIESLERRGDSQLLRVLLRCLQECVLQIQLRIERGVV